MNPHKHKQQPRNHVVFSTQLPPSSTNSSIANQALLLGRRFLLQVDVYPTPPNRNAHPLTVSYASVTIRIIVHGMYACTTPHALLYPALHTRAVDPGAPDLSTVRTGSMRLQSEAFQASAGLDSQKSESMTRGGLGCSCSSSDGSGGGTTGAEIHNKVADRL